MWQPRGGSQERPLDEMMNNAEVSFGHEMCQFRLLFADEMFLVPGWSPMGGTMTSGSGGGIRITIGDMDCGRRERRFRIGLGTEDSEVG